MHISSRYWIPLSLALMTFSGPPAQSEEFYRWRDTQGVAHYGHKPPRGVNATKVKVYGTQGGSGTQRGSGQRKSAQAQQKPAALAEAKGEQDSKAPGDRAARDEKCRAERKRLATLQANQPIRMKGPDGSLAYLSREEIAREIQLSKDYLQADCVDLK